MQDLVENPIDRLEGIALWCHINDGYLPFSEFIGAHMSVFERIK